MKPPQGWLVTPDGRLLAHRAAKLEVTAASTYIVLGADIIASLAQEEAVRNGTGKPDRLQLAIPLAQAKMLVASLQRRILELEQAPPGKIPD